MKLSDLLEVEVRDDFPNAKPLTKPLTRNDRPVLYNPRARSSLGTDDKKSQFERECIKAQDWYKQNVQSAVNLFYRQPVMEFKDMYELQDYFNEHIFVDGSDTESYSNIKQLLDKIQSKNPKLFKDIHRLTLNLNNVIKFGKFIYDRLESWYKVIKPSRGRSFDILIMYALDSKQTAQLDVCLQLYHIGNNLQRYFSSI